MRHLSEAGFIFEDSQGGRITDFSRIKAQGEVWLWRHKDKSGYGSKTQDEDRSDVLANRTIHKICPQQVKDYELR